MGRMNVITKTKENKPPRLVLYGTQGVGKSTWAASAPRPVFLPVEDGLSEIEAEAWPQPESLTEVFEALDGAASDPGFSFQTVVIDTLDALERIVWQDVCREGGKKGIEDFGYGKGYTAALEKWRLLLSRLDALRDGKGCNIVLLAHSHQKIFSNPIGEDYTRYQLALHDKASNLIQGWATAVLFAIYEEFAHKDKDGKVRGVSDGSRLIHTQRNAAWDAKNRYDLPPELPMPRDGGWQVFDQARGSSAAPPPDGSVTDQIAALIEQADPATKTQASAALQRCGGDPEKLSQLANWLKGKAA